MALVLNPDWVEVRLERISYSLSFSPYLYAYAI